MLEISVIVPVRDGAPTLAKLLRSLNAQDLDRDRYEVIVIDNASRDGTAAVAESSGARVGREPIANRSRARNAGVAMARAPKLAFIDADCEPSRSWLRSLLHHAGSEALVAGPVEVQTGRPANAIERFETAWRFDQERWAGEGWAATANLMVERCAFDAVGGFDPGYRYGEDADFCLRARRRGLALGFCPQAVVRHGAERDIGPVIRRSFYHGYGAAHLMARMGVGHVAWRHPGPVLSPSSALAWYGIPPSAERSERISQKALAWLTYSCRVAGSIWASLARAR